MIKSKGSVNRRGEEGKGSRSGKGVAVRRGGGWKKGGSEGGLIRACILGKLGEGCIEQRYW